MKRLCNWYQNAKIMEMKMTNGGCDRYHEMRLKEVAQRAGIKTQFLDSYHNFLTKLTHCHYCHNYQGDYPDE